MNKEKNILNMEPFAQEGVGEFIVEMVGQQLIDRVIGDTPIPETEEEKRIRVEKIMNLMEGIGTQVKNIGGFFSSGYGKMRTMLTRSKPEIQSEDMSSQLREKLGTIASTVMTDEIVQDISDITGVPLSANSSYIVDPINQWTANPPLDALHHQQLEIDHTCLANELRLTSLIFNSLSDPGILSPANITLSDSASSTTSAKLEQKILAYNDTQKSIAKFWNLSVSSHSGLSTDIKLPAAALHETILTFTTQAYGINGSQSDSVMMDMLEGAIDIYGQTTFATTYNAMIDIEQFIFNHPLTSKTTYGYCRINDNVEKIRELYNTTLQYSNFVKEAEPVASNVKLSYDAAITLSNIFDYVYESGQGISLGIRKYTPELLSQLQNVFDISMQANKVALESIDHLLSSGAELLTKLPFDKLKPIQENVMNDLKNQLSNDLSATLDQVKSGGTFMVEFAQKTANSIQQLNRKIGKIRHDIEHTPLDVKFGGTIPELLLEQCTTALYEPVQYAQSVLPIFTRATPNIKSLSLLSEDQYVRLAARIITKIDFTALPLTTDLIIPYAVEIYKFSNKLVEASTTRTAHIPVEKVDSNVLLGITSLASAAIFLKPLVSFIDTGASVASKTVGLLTIDPPTMFIPDGNRLYEIATISSNTILNELASNGANAATSLMKSLSIRNIAISEAPVSMDFFRSSIVASQNILKGISSFYPGNTDLVVADQQIASNFWNSINTISSTTAELAGNSLSSNLPTWLGCNQHPFLCVATLLLSPAFLYGIYRIFTLYVLPVLKKSINAVYETTSASSIFGKIKGFLGIIGSTVSYLYSFGGFQSIIHISIGLFIFMAVLSIAGLAAPVLSIITLVASFMQYLGIDLISRLDYQAISSLMIKTITTFTDIVSNHTAILAGATAIATTLGAVTMLPTPKPTNTKKEHVCPTVTETRCICTECPMISSTTGGIDAAQKMTVNAMNAASKAANIVSSGANLVSSGATITGTVGKTAIDTTVKATKGAIKIGQKIGSTVRRYSPRKTSVEIASPKPKKSISLKPVRKSVKKECKCPSSVPQKTKSKRSAPKCTSLPKKDVLTASKIIGIKTGKTTSKNALCKKIDKKINSR